MSASPILGCSPVGAVEFAVSPKSMSLNALLQNESFQQLRTKADHLARLADEFPGYNGILSNPIADGELDGVLRLSGNIVNSLDKIVLLRNQLQNAESQILLQVLEPARNVRMKRVPRKTGSHACHNCERTDTPKWRAGPHGPRSLCNVCGLLNAKREKRHMLRCPPRPVST
ncbi:GATA zinc finger domain-containing protein 7 [Ophiocordyceps camponoti-floridani]|uniref:GATA zinc finger domain-containing protein 7 n=1 Tax=Ophiocordyceps camponoti-floridani TaxID=2030778 RepID=A0A8H4Q6T9_9HYPO|nr:GATA zinc finger domain-containing protein 7 [Ophiocordyceps camponoti-floridani]